MPSESKIRELLETQSLSPSTVTDLEDFLTAQVKGQTPYYADSVRKLVKLYQLFPETTKTECIGRACFLALLEFPNPDFLALSYMIAPSILSQEPCSTVQKCSTLLEACNFVEFWKTYETLQANGDGEIAQLAKQSIPHLQCRILQALAVSYKEAPLSVVSNALQMDSLTNEFLQQHPSAKSVVDRIDGDTVIFRSSVDNTKRERVYQESVNFSSISQLMAKLAQ